MMEWTVVDYFLTFLWTALNYIGAVQLYDGFSKRKFSAKRFWGVTVGYVLINGIALNSSIIANSSNSKMLLVIALYALFHQMQYVGNGMFNIYIAVIYYAITCCTENVVFTAAMLNRSMANGFDSLLSIISCLSAILICRLLKRQRVTSSAKVGAWQWYSVPAILSLITTLLIFYYGECYHSNQISIKPLFVCALFLTLVQITALFLVSWMELNAHLREEALSLHTRSQAQQESIEALSLAYAQQRKLTHDFQSHIDVLYGLLSGSSLEDAKSYLCKLQKSQTSRILLVNTYNATLDALLNQKASVALNRSIDVQFSVNDLSLLKIDMTDLTVIISNILDNAIEASEKLMESERQIFVKVLLEGDSLFFSVRNRSEPVAIIPGQLPLSTKENATLHGFGLENVRTTLSKYKAIYSMNYDKGWFSFATELPNTLLS